MARSGVGRGVGRTAHVVLLVAVLVLTGCFDRTPPEPEPAARPRSAPTATCPSADIAEVARDPFVRAQTERAWRRSRPGTAERQEHGGWFTQHRGTDPETGEPTYWMEYHERDPGEARSMVLLPVPTTGDDVRVVAHLHTHPQADPRLDSGWANPTDEGFANGVGVPGLIRYGHGADNVVVYGPESARLTWDCPGDPDDGALSFDGACDKTTEATFTIRNPAASEVDYQATGGPTPTTNATGTLAGGEQVTITVEIPQGECSCEPYTVDSEITVAFSGEEGSPTQRIATRVNYPARPGPECAQTHGDPHLRTFDGLAYTFQAVGEFILVHDPAAPQDLAIHVRQSPWFSSRNVSINEAVGAAVAGDRVQFDTREGGRLHLDDEPIEVDDGGALELPGGGTIHRDAAHYRVDWPSGEVLTVANFGSRRGSGALTLTVSIPQGRATAGLFGDRDLDPGTDLRDRDGNIFAQPIEFATLYGPFADAWRVTDADSLLPYGPGETTASYTDRSFPDRRMHVEDLDADQLAAAMAVCNPLDLDERAMDECLIDVAMTGDHFFAEVAASAPPADANLQISDAGPADPSAEGAPNPDPTGPGHCQDHASGSVGDGRAMSVTGAAADRVDIVEHCVRWDETMLQFAVRVADPFDPLDDDAWKSPDTRLRWTIDADGTPITVTLFRIEDEMYATLTQDAEGRLCDVVDAGLRDRWLVAMFPDGCLGAATSLSYSISSLYDLDASRPEKSEAPETLLHDVVPGQDGMVGPIERGSDPDPGPPPGRRTRSTASGS